MPWSREIKRQLVQEQPASGGSTTSVSSTQARRASKTLPVLPGGSIPPSGVGTPPSRGLAGHCAGFGKAATWLALSKATLKVSSRTVDAQLHAPNCRGALASEVTYCPSKVALREMPLTVAKAVPASRSRENIAWNPKPESGTSAKPH